MPGLCVVSSAIMSVLDGPWRLVFCVFCVTRVMSFAMGEDVSEIVVCKRVVCSVVLGFAGDAVVDFDAWGVEWSRWFPPYVGTDVLSGGGGVARGVVFAGNAVFNPRMWRLCEVCAGSGVRGWRTIGKDWGLMSG